ncbi:MAG: hypothetical protein KC729_10280, partial [Candidatus Eisenbacteria bacterium]|nr:hypothetical protein [Candidatus Eisenbacteria bacterium]
MAESPEYGGATDTTYTSTTGRYAFARQYRSATLLIRSPHAGNAWYEQISAGTIRFDAAFAAIHLTVVAPPEVAGDTLLTSFIGTDLQISHILTTGANELPEVDLVPQRSYTIQLRFRGNRILDWEGSRLRPEPGQNLTLEHALGRPTTLRVHLVPPGWSAFFPDEPTLATSFGTLHAETSEAEPVYTISYPGNIDDVLTLSLGGSRTRVAVIAADGSSTDVDVPTGGMRVDLTDGEPSRTAWIAAVDETGTVIQREQGRFDANGNAGIPLAWLPPGSVRIHAYEDQSGWPRRWADQWYPGVSLERSAVGIDVTSSSDRTVIAFPLIRGGYVHARVIEHEGARSAEGVLYSTEEDREYDGSNWWSGLPPGLYRFRVCPQLGSDPGCLYYPYGTTESEG